MNDDFKTQQLGITNLEENYRRFAEIFGCTDWNVARTESGLIAQNTRCTLCAIARKQGAPQPCRPFCINPFTSYTKVFGFELEVESTLWDGERCRFVNTVKEAGDV
jgi:hypothetical protein